MPPKYSHTLVEIKLSVVCADSFTFTSSLSLELDTVIPARVNLVPQICNVVLKKLEGVQGAVFSD